jgi:hypothetical protein
LNLRISTKSLANNPTEQGSNTHPITRFCQYNINPTLPIGKLVTVYSAVDAVNDSKVDIQVQVQPLEVK